MVKAFMVKFKKKAYSADVFGYTTTVSSPTLFEDNRGTIAIANNIKDVAERFPDAESINELISKDVVILEKIICPVK
jgi:hypothetical protein